MSPNLVVPTSVRDQSRLFRVHAPHSEAERVGSAESRQDKLSQQNCQFLASARNAAENSAYRQQVSRSIQIAQGSSRSISFVYWSGLLFRPLLIWAASMKWRRKRNGKWLPRKWGISRISRRVWSIITLSCCIPMIKAVSRTARILRCVDQLLSVRASDRSLIPLPLSTTALYRLRR